MTDKNQEGQKPELKPLRFTVDEIVWLHPDEMIPYVNNHKKHPYEQIDDIATQIIHFGYDQHYSA